MTCARRIGFLFVFFSVCFVVLLAAKAATSLVPFDVGGFFYVFAGYYLFPLVSYFSRKDIQMRYLDEVQYKAVSGTVKKVTNKAVLLILASRHEQWIPQSCISVASLADIGEGFIGEIEVADWFCKKEGL